MHSRLARLQQFSTLAIVGVASAFLAWRWRESPPAALIGFLLIAFSYSLVLAVEFAMLRWLGQAPRAEAPSVRELFSAWCGETLHGIRVFAWRQPFRWRAIGDELGAHTRGRRGVVFIHGFVCNRGFWNPWMERLRTTGHAYVAVNLEPVFGSIEDYAAIIEDAVQRVACATGMPPALVCHSMGGLAARWWLQEHGRPERVSRIVTIGTPHRGTWLGHFSRRPNGREMRLGSPWLSALEAPVAAVPFTCWYSNCDNIVFPTVTATLEGADNRLVRGVAHVQLAFVPQVMDETLRLALQVSAV